MENFLTFLSKHSSGIFILILIFFSAILILNWLAKIFQWGRYKAGKSTLKESDNFGYIITQFFVNLISDFKHFLALVIVIIFTTLIIYSMTTTDVFAEKMDALKLIIASLGGLLGSIIGYYFGESAGRSSSTSISNITDTTQGSSSNDDIQAAPQINLDNN